jgi:sulfoxide reductase heme-binding subunit YedZ
MPGWTSSGTTEPGRRPGGGERPAARGAGLPRALKPALFALSLLPLARLVLAGTHGWFGGLGANPIELITRSTGTWTLVFLVASLAVTPLRRATGLNALIRVRRMLGLFAFFYGALHFTTYLWFDQWFDPDAIVRDVIRRPFVTMGVLAFALMIPLAATSTDAMVRRLGRRWSRLHRLVYAVAVAAVLHYAWHKAGKNDYSEVAWYAAAVALLLGWRVVDHWRTARRARRVAAPVRQSRGSARSPANRSSMRSRSRTRWTRSPSTITSAPRGRVL